MTKDEELRLIGRVLDGDQSAFEPLVLDNQKSVYNLALRMTGNEEDALDISQEVFIKAYSGLASFRGESRLGFWLYRLTYNMCIDLSRKKKRENVSSITYLDESGEETDLEIPDLRQLPENEAERSELRQAVRDAIDRLSPEHRNMLLLREISGMSYTEIAQALDLNEGTVKSRLARARIKLAEILVKNGTFEPLDRQVNGKGVKTRG